MKKKDIKTLTREQEEAVAAIDKMMEVFFGKENAWFTARGICKELYYAGYRKQVWHKVADGDLPERKNKDIVAIQVIVYYIDNCGYEITEAMFYFFTEKKFRLLNSHENIKNIIAWTEFPEYKE